MPDKLLYETPFLSLIDRDGYIFSHEKRSDGVIVVVLPFRPSGQGYEFLAHVERVPAHTTAPDAFAPYSLTGGVDPGHNVIQTAVAELYEEAGYRCTDAELIELGTVRPSKSADTVVHLFAVNVAGKPADTPQGDGSHFETGTYPLWLSYSDAVQVTDPLFVTAVTRLLAHLDSGSSMPKRERRSFKKAH